jgi:hypothetical protein
MSLETAKSEDWIMRSTLAGLQQSTEGLLPILLLLNQIQSWPNAICSGGDNNQRRSPDIHLESRKIFPIVPQPLIPH